LRQDNSILKEEMEELRKVIFEMNKEKIDIELKLNKLEEVREIDRFRLLEEENVKFNSHNLASNSELLDCLSEISEEIEEGSDKGSVASKNYSDYSENSKRPTERSTLPDCYMNFLDNRHNKGNN
jgi:hypothetical protein